MITIVDFRWLRTQFSHHIRPADLYGVLEKLTIVIYSRHSPISCLWNITSFITTNSFITRCTGARCNYKTNQIFVVSAKRNELPGHYRFSRRNVPGFRFKFRFSTWWKTYIVYSWVMSSGYQYCFELWWYFFLCKNLKW